MKKLLNVDKTFNGMRIDRFLRNHFGQIPQSLIEKNLRNGKIKLNKKKVKSSFKVKSGDQLIIIEAMKMETTVYAEQDGTLSEVLVSPGSPVEAGELIARYGEDWTHYLFGKEETTTFTQAPNAAVIEVSLLSKVPWRPYEPLPLWAQQRLGNRADNHYSRNNLGDSSQQDKKPLLSQVWSRSVMGKPLIR